MTRQKAEFIMNGRVKTCLLTTLANIFDGDVPPQVTRLAV